MIDNDVRSDSSFEAPVADPDPFGLLPRLSRGQARLSERLARCVRRDGPGTALGWLDVPLGARVEFGGADVTPRPTGLKRTGVVAQLAWPRLGTRVGLGIETPLAHALVDRFLGHDRPGEASRLPISPVEWGILTFATAETLRRLARHDGPLGPWDLLIDRIGPDPFDPADLGQVITVRWPARLGGVESSVRLWLPESLVGRWLSSPPPAPTAVTLPARSAEMAGAWRALAGTIRLPRGLATLRVGGVLPLIHSTLRGTPQRPSGAVSLALDLTAPRVRWSIPAEAVPESGGRRLRLTDRPRSEPILKEDPSVNTATNPTDAPVTLVVELGRLNLTLGRLADLKPGDVVDLARHSREPVELTSGGRVVARGELVQIDTDLGVRVTHVFL